MLALFEPSYIDDEEEEEESIVRFLTALEAELAELSVGTNEYDLQRSPQPLVLTSR